MSKEEESKAGIKFTDKRRFDDSGNLREEEGSGSQSKSTPDRSASKAQSFDESPPTQSEPELNFASFLVSLATQALMQMGEIAPPPGVDIPVNRDAARQTIDILEMLKVKTKNNLDEAENRLIDEILYNVRMAFVKIRG